MKDKVVRCVYDFPAETDKDLDLRVGDVVRVTRIINSDWYEGQVHNRCGQFPAAYVEDCADVFDLVVAERAFAGEQEGDLSFESGEYVVVTEIVDENWMRGYVQGGSFGLFPRSFVKEIKLEASEMSAIMGEVPQDNGTNGDVGAEVAKGATVDVSDEDEEMWVDVLDNFNAMDSNELTLVAGTKVKVLCDVDDFWCKGVDKDGEEGIFPRNFVNLPETETTEAEIVESDPVPKTKVAEVVVDPPVVTPKPQNEEVRPIGKMTALFNFAGPEKGDLTFNQGDEILLLENINTEWMKGMINNEVGIFPSNYVQVVEMFNETNSSSSTKVANDAKKSPRSDSPAATTEPKKPPPPKPSKPQRPKLPDSKKLSEEISPFTYDLKLNSKPLVIIPVKYRKQGSPNVVILKNWRREELEELKHNRER